MQYSAGSRPLHIGEWVDLCYTTFTVSDNKAATHRAPKQWALTRHETVTTCENWRQTLINTFSLDREFEPFMREGVEWQKSNTNATRGLSPLSVTAAAKCT